MSETQRLFERAKRVAPGGVHSPVRAFRAVAEPPLIVREARGPYLIDVEGNRLIDYVLSWGPLLLGHAHPAVLGALREALGRGTSYGFSCEAELELAELIVEMVPSVEMVRFVNSGTEATMAAVRLARAATGRDLILKFEGCYHGHADSFLVAAGSGVATLSLPDSPGVPSALAALTLVCGFNDLDCVREQFERYGERIAAVIVEPFIGNAGLIPPLPEFLPGLREITREYGALLIFDEVMTGFRVHSGGAQALTGVMPDLTTLGKVIGGGLPVGAYGGRRELMELIAPAGPVYQAGTLSGNPLAMTAGLATLKTARAEGAFEILPKKASWLADALEAEAKSLGVPLSVTHAGSMWGFFFSPNPVSNFAQAKASDVRTFAKFHRAARERGVLLPPSAFEACFVSLAHDDAVIEETVEKLAAALRDAIQG
ncbi:MAG: glutamate-1-semialdehyde 2,1-aminomutase [Gemmatimonadales bacterium]|nr:MAG: glutamate-1-semialdehyde 2,1-aminomutase [Gemmatimonadales bacterium]